MLWEVALEKAKRQKTKNKKNHCILNIEYLTKIVPIDVFTVVYIYIYIYLHTHTHTHTHIGPYPQHMEIPRLGVESEL